MNTINIHAILRSSLYGVLATGILFLVYSSILTLVSGFPFMVEQFSTFWYFITSLAVGFGLQIGLYTYLKGLIHHKDVSSGNVVAVSGTTSTVAMISCCAHYLVNILPLLGATGFVAIVAQYQVKMFWLGIVASLLGILYITNKIMIFKKEHG